MSTATERWSPVLGYEGLYEVSDQGRVHSIERHDRLGRRVRGRILRSRPFDKVGHLAVNLYNEDGPTSRSVHSLVAEAFLTNPEGFPLVRHLDGDPTRNQASNLAYGTHAMNYADGQSHGTLPTAQHGTHSMYVRGCRCRSCKTAAADVARARRSNDPDYAARQRVASRKSAAKRRALTKENA